MTHESRPLILKHELELPDESLQRKALIELRETPLNIEKGLKELKTLLEAEKDLVVPISNDEWLLVFLRTCKFYPESALDLVKRFYSMRHKYSEIKNLLVPSKLRHVFEANLVTIFPQRDQHGRRIVLTRSGKLWDYKTITQDELLSSSVLCSNLLQKEPATQINGIVYILDMEDLTFSHALRLTPYVSKRTLDFIQQENPLRVKGFHIVNQPKIFQPVFAALKSFFSEKFAKRILMHGKNYESLHQYVEPEYLPKCYGGLLENDVVCYQDTYKLLMPYESEFIELQKYGVKT